MRKDGYDLFRCSECRHIFVWPIPTLDQLKHVYSFANSYQVQERVIYNENTAVLAKARESLREIEKFCRQRGRLLDVGCSSGSFLWLAKRHGWTSVCGVELNKDTAEIARGNGFEVFVGELAAAHLRPCSFDAIHVGDVIEHVQHPGELLCQISELLRSEGVILLVTPNHDAVFPILTYWLHQLFNVPWSHPTPPYHLNQFSERSLANLVQKSDLQVVEKRYRGCVLRYELGETHVLRSFREALAQRQWTKAAARLLFAVFTVGAYCLAYGVDRCCVWKKKDFEMTFAVRKAPHDGRVAKEPAVQAEPRTAGVTH
jgi:2-polyprenyl-3-methyl-5-hydroxy-6-metoxy-1,4-benzoquinol methylase